MKKIGLVGGIGPASTVEYYLGIVKRCLEERENSVYPEIVIDSVNMLKHDAAFEKGDYSLIGKYLLCSLNNLKAAGAEVAAITANTEHIAWDKICDSFPLPVISIVDETVREVKRKNYKRALIFGTDFTLRSGLYERALEAEEVTVIVPCDEDITLLGKLIYPNLENGVVVPEDKARMIELADRYIKEGSADALILGCTELPLAIEPGDVEVPVINTTQVHIDAICRWAFGD